MVDSPSALTPVPLSHVRGERGAVRGILYGEVAFAHAQE